MNSRGRGATVGFRGGRGAPRLPTRGDDNNGGNGSGGRGAAAGGGGRGGFAQQGGRGRGAAAVPRRVVTVVTESGTELPRRLNNKVFIDGLPYEHTPPPGGASLEDELMQFVTAWKVGRPLRLIKKDGQGFGFLVLHSPHSVDVAVRVLNGRKFLGRTLRVEVPKPKDLDAVDADNVRDAGKSSHARQVLLSDLAKITQPEILREIMRDVAPQLEKRLESIKMASNNRKAFLTFLSADDVGPAVQFLDGFSMLGRRISAARAAAPGSLPFSKVPSHNLARTRNGMPANASGSDKAKHINNSNEEEGEEEPLLPLGVVSAPAKRHEAKSVERRVVTTKEAKPSNITGVTEKYNLLEEGPTEVFVGNLGEEVTEEQLRSHFSACGKIVECEIIVNKNTSLPTGIARLVFALPAYASYAQRHMHGSRLRGQVIRVDRGGEASAPLTSELAPHDDEEAVDEDGYMEHYGVKDKAAYFKGTSFEEKGDGSKKSKRVREAAADSKAKRKTKTARTEEESELKTSCSILDEDEDECFYDVDKVDVPRAASVGRRVAKKRPATTKRVGKAKKSSK